MKFIEMSGKMLLSVIDQINPSPKDLAQVGVTPESIVRVNRQGDIELRRADRWDLIGGLLGDFEHVVRSHTGLDWVSPIADGENGQGE